MVVGFREVRATVLSFQLLTFFSIFFSFYFIWIYHLMHNFKFFLYKNKNQDKRDEICVSLDYTTNFNQKKKIITNIMISYDFLFLFFIVLIIDYV